MAGARTIVNKVGEVTTTDTTKTVCVSYTIPSNGIAFSAEAVVVGRDTSTGDPVIVKKTSAGKRASDATSIVGAIVASVGNISNSLLSTVSVDIETSGTAVRVMVTGKASTTIDWHATLTITLN